MAVVARILGYSLLAAGPGGVCLGYALAGYDPGFGLPGFVLACVGAIVGAVAGAAGEIVTAQRRFAETKPPERMAKSCEALD